MKSLQKTAISFFILFALFLAGVGGAHLINTDSGSITVHYVTIPHGNLNLSGLLYKPDVATASTPQPAVIIAHGISNSKDVVSGIALELARRDFVALAVDSLGHGNSEGELSKDTENTLGIMAAVQWIEIQPFVNKSAIGLVGHSLGASAIRATAAEHGNIGASVFIGGGLDSSYLDVDFAILNSSSPKNLLFIIGEFDVLFSLEELKSETLVPIFNTTEKIVPNRLYGSFDQQNARKLVVPKTSHLFEAMLPSIASETVDWMVNSLTAKSINDVSPQVSTTVFLYRDMLLLLSLLMLVGSLFPLSVIALRAVRTSFKRFLDEATVHSAGGHQLSVFEGPRFGHLADWRASLIWGLLSLTLIVPMLMLGSAFPWPPLIFGESFAWWMVLVGLSAFFLVTRFGSKFSTVSINVRTLIRENVDRVSTITALLLFFFLFLVAFLLEIVFHLNLRIIVPIFNDLGPIPRYLAFLMLIPFAFVYFFVEGLFFHDFHDWRMRNDLGSKKGELKAVMRVILHKILPYVIILILFYVPLFSVGILVVPGQIGFFLEFLVPIVPIFMITTAVSWWFYRQTGKVGMGALFNALLIAWMMASLFPMKPWL